MKEPMLSGMAAVVKELPLQFPRILDATDEFDID
jgi:hypothetical protein